MRAAEPLAPRNRLAWVVLLAAPLAVPAWATPPATALPARATAPLQVDCRAAAGRLLAGLDLTPAIDARLEDRLGSGLASTVRLTVAVLDGSGAAIAQAERQFDVRLDVWTEIFSVTVRDPGGELSSRQATDWPAVRSLLAHPAAFDLGPLAALPERFTVEARLELDPVTARQLEKTREQLTHPAGTRSLLGTLAAILLRAPPPDASRYRSPPLTRAGLLPP